jgi:SAM-dependent methyltransferase
MKPELFEVIACPRCGGDLSALGDDLPGDSNRLTCQSCGWLVPVQNQIPLFSAAPEGLAPSEKLIRGPDIGTPWRQANWRFLQEQIARLGPETLILDVGAGRGDFAAIFEGRRYLALDVYPYPEVDLVCDLTEVIPFKRDSFDAIVLMNVMEHVYDTHNLLAALSKLLKPGGLLFVAIPFLVKIHQAPIDFVRYTHFSLQRLGEDHNLQVKMLEGYYDPVFFLGEGIGNLRWAVAPSLRGVRRYATRAALLGIRAFARVFEIIGLNGNTQSPAQARSMAATGYHVVYEKYASETYQSPLS